jgi:2'-hydroxyisoflavone reductase
MRLLVLGGTVFLGRHEPADVARSSALDIGHLVFVSTCNVYPAWPSEPVDDDSPVWADGDDYGPKKAACEREAEAALPGRVAKLRAGLLCGPHDNIFRLPWWVRRIAAGGDVVAPGDPDRTVQLIDARDLASWMLDLAERGVAGRRPACAGARSPRRWPTRGTGCATAARPGSTRGAPRTAPAA